jgi:hypothetical protein
MIVLSNIISDGINMAFNVWFYLYNFIESFKMAN